MGAGYPRQVEVYSPGAHAATLEGGTDAGIRALPLGLTLLVTDFNARLLALQEIAFRLHQEKAHALEENAQLRAQIRQKEEGAADRECYELRKIGSSVAIVRKDDPDTYLCATCYEAGRKVYLTKLDHKLSRG